MNHNEHLLAGHPALSSLLFMLHPGSTFRNSHAYCPLVTFLMWLHDKVPVPSQGGRVSLPWRFLYISSYISSLIVGSKLKSLYSLQNSQCLVTSLGLCLHCFLGIEYFPPKNQPILGQTVESQGCNLGQFYGNQACLFPFIPCKCQIHLLLWWEIQGEGYPSMPQSPVCWASSMYWVLGI